MRAPNLTNGQQGDACATSGAVGQRLGALFSIEDAPALFVRKLGMSAMAVTEIRSDNPRLGLLDPVPTEDAFLLSLLLNGLEHHQVWENGRPCPRHSITAGQFYLRDLKRPQSSLIEQPHHSLQFYLPRSWLDELAADADKRSVGELSYIPGVPIDDAVVWGLGSSLRSAFERPGQVNRLFLEHVIHALGIHLAQNYGQSDFGWKARRGGLTGWQERRAKDAINSNLGGGLSLRDLAQQCGLSTSHFSKAFKESTGLAPHQWLIRRRVEVAKTLLRNPGLSLAEVAVQCGFADQSHLTRVFSRIVGISPGAWRRTCEIPVPPAGRTRPRKG